MYRQEGLYSKEAALFIIITVQIKERSSGMTKKELSTALRNYVFYLNFAGDCQRVKNAAEGGMEFFSDPERQKKIGELGEEFIHLIGAVNAVAESLREISKKEEEIIQMIGIFQETFKETVKQLEEESRFKK